MVCFHNSYSFDHHIEMAKSVYSSDSCSKLKLSNQLNKCRRIPNHLNIPACEQSPYAMIDVVISIAVIGAFAVLLYPCVMFLVHKSVEIGGEVVDVMREEIVRSPAIFGCLGLGFVFAVITVVVITVFMERRCGKPGCKGLNKGAEFDIQLETEETVRKSTYAARTVLKKGIFELPREYCRELEGELKKIAPVNGKAVLVFKARCGCSVVRLEVPGPKKSKKVKN